MKYVIENGTKVTLNLSSNIVGDSNDENNFSHKLLLTNTQVSRLRKAFANNSSTIINCQKFNHIKLYNQDDFYADL